jgi:hypothetical protein
MYSSIQRPLLLFGAALLLAAESPAFASCMYPAACFEVRGAIQHCREITQDSQRFLELTLASPAIGKVACNSETRDPIGAELENRQKYLETRKHFYIGSWHQKSCAKLDAARFSGVVEETCCDTVPVGGACALDGPILIPAP